jgi:pilus assembly protein CpaF
VTLFERVAAARQGRDALTPPGTTASDPAGASPGATPASTPSAPSPSTPAAVPVAPSAAVQRRTSSREEALRELRTRLQDQAVDEGTTLLSLKRPEDIRVALVGMLDGLVLESGTSLTRVERDRMLDTVFHEITGLGPIEPLLADTTITEVMVNGPRQVYIERGGKLERIDVAFKSEEHVRHIIDRIIAPLGRRIDESSPRVDARLADGSRVNAIIKPLSLIGPVITVRKFAARPYTVDDLVRFGTATDEMFQFLRACIEARLNVFLSGGTGSGKTTTLNVLSSFIPEGERIITIEDAAELQLKQKHVVTLEARPPNLEGRGEITIRDLLRNSLHMRPDRIVVGECRAGEALDMIQAMTTGHEGSMSTGHANTPEDMLRRIETMILMTGYELPMRAIREQIASAVDLIVHTARLRDGSRKIVSIVEVFGIEDDHILTQEIFTFRQTDFRDGQVIGQLEPTGIRPTFMPLFAIKDVALPPGEFGIPPEDPDRPSRASKARWTLGTSRAMGGTPATVGQGRVTTAGGMVYVSSVGPVDPATRTVRTNDLTEQTRLCLRNLQAKLEAAGSSLQDVVWANWSLREPSDFDEFNEEWIRWFPGDGPIGQGTLLPLSHRRAGFRVSIGVIAAGADAPAVHAPGAGWAPASARPRSPLERPRRHRRRRRPIVAIPVERRVPVATPAAVPVATPAAVPVATPVAAPAAVPPPAAVAPPAPFAPAAAVTAPAMPGVTDLGPVEAPPHRDPSVVTIVEGGALPLGDIDPELYARHFPDPAPRG